MAKEITITSKRNHLPTEKQLLAMPASEYMNAIQLAFFRHRLQELELEIHNNTDTTAKTLRGIEFVSDPNDRATIEEAYGVEFRTRDRERKLLTKIRQAFSRIESGEYGWCDETGESIGLGRLLARPTATLTLEAQERRELRQKSYEYQ